MASIEDQPIYNNDDDVDIIDDDGDDDSTSSPSLAGEVTIAVTGAGGGGSGSDSLSLPPEPKRPRLEDFTVPVALPVQEKKPPPAFDDSRKLFQRLWTDDDEIELLQGFLDYTRQRGANGSSSQHQHHYDTTAFYDQIKNKFQLDFNKNQLVEKLRRLKKKYRTVMSKMASGKEFVFKSAHDQITFEISRQIWNNLGSAVRGSGGGGGGGGDGGFDDDDAHLNPSPNPNANANSMVVYSPNFNLNSNPNGIDSTETPRSSKRCGGVAANTGAVKVEHKSGGSTTANVATPVANSTTPMAAAGGAAAAAPMLPSLIEETVRNCVSPIFKELLNSVANLNGSNRGLGLGGMAMSPIPIGFGGGGSMSMEMMGDEKWRKQQMLELEVYSKRLELVQDQIKAQLDELRKMGD